MSEWETAVNGVEVNSNGVPIVISIDFDEVKSGAHEIDVFWADITPTAFWDPGATDFTFDESPTVNFSDAAGDIRLPGTVDCGPMIHLPSAWYFGGAGAVPDVTSSYQLCNADGTFTDKSRTFKAYDVYTIALHELGHAWGLQHFGTGLMRTDLSGFVMHDPDAGSIDGVKDLYSIPVPLPATLALLTLGLAGVPRRRRWTC